MRYRDTLINSATILIRRSICVKSSLIASLDLGLQNISFFTHSYGSPRTFDPNAARLWNFLYGGGKPTQHSTLVFPANWEALQT